MKLHLIATSLLLTATLSAPAFAADVVVPIGETMIVLPSNAYVAMGMHRDAVVAQLGEPGDKLSPDIWVYWDFRVKGRPAGDKADTLIVVFTEDRVTRLRATEQQPVVALLKQLRLKATQKTTIASR